MPHINQHLDAIKPIVRDAGDESPLSAWQFANDLAHRVSRTPAQRVRVREVVRQLAQIDMGPIASIDRIVICLTERFDQEDVPLSARIDIVDMLDRVGLLVLEEDSYHQLIAQSLLMPTGMTGHESLGWKGKVVAMEGYFLGIRKHLEGYGRYQQYLELCPDERAFVTSMANQFIGVVGYDGADQIRSTVGERRRTCYLHLVQVFPLMDAIQNGYPLENLATQFATTGVERVVLTCQHFNQLSPEEQVRGLRRMKAIVDRNQTWYMRALLAVVRWMNNLSFTKRVGNNIIRKQLEKRPSSTDP